MGGSDDEQDFSDEELSSGDEGEKHNDSDPKTKDQVDRRRERNRVLARKTRLRKKSFFESLQRQVAQLATENSMLKGIVKHRMGPEVKDQGIPFLSLVSSTHPLFLHHSTRKNKPINISD